MVEQHALEVAIGEKARQMHGKTHEDIKTIRPLRDGVIADFQAAELMIRGMIKMINTKRRLFTPSLKMVVCIPSGSTEVERGNLSRPPGDSCGERVPSTSCESPQYAQRLRARLASTM